MEHEEEEDELALFVANVRERLRQHDERRRWQEERAELLQWHEADGLPENRNPNPRAQARRRREEELERNGPPDPTNPSPDGMMRVRDVPREKFLREAHLNIEPHVAFLESIGSIELQNMLAKYLPEDTSEPRAPAQQEQQPRPSHPLRGMWRPRRGPPTSPLGGLRPTTPEASLNSPARRQQAHEGIINDDRGVDNEVNDSDERQVI